MNLLYESAQIGDTAEFCVIWMHGLGADGHDFTPIVPELGLTDSPGVRFVFPHAPQQPVTINGGYVMRAWYDIYGKDLTVQQDQEGIEESSKLIEQLIEEQEALGIASDKIIMAGFSQGGAMALHLGLRSERKFAGIMALSTYLPLANELPLSNASDKSPPVFMAHGQFDSVVSIQAGLKSKEALEKLGYNVLWKEYPMEHSVCGQEVADIGHWLQTIIK